MMHGAQFLVMIYHRNEIRLGGGALPPKEAQITPQPDSIKSKLHQTSHHEHARIFILTPRSGAEGHIVSINWLQALTGYKQ